MDSCVACDVSPQLTMTVNSGTLLHLELLTHCSNRSMMVLGFVLLFKFLYESIYHKICGENSFWAHATFFVCKRSPSKYLTSMKQLYPTVISNT